MIFRNGMQTMATVTMNDIMKKIKDNGLEGKVHARDLVLGGKTRSC